MRRGGKINGNKREKRIDVGIETTRGSETWGDTSSRLSEQFREFDFSKERNVLSITRIILSPLEISSFSNLKPALMSREIN